MSRQRALADAPGDVDGAWRSGAVGRLLVVATVALAVVAGTVTAGTVAAGAVGGAVAEAPTGTATAGPNGAMGLGGDSISTAGSDRLANETRVVHPGDTLTLQSGPGQAVRGRSGLPAGTVLTVRLQSTDADDPYLRSATTIVGADGRFRAVFDLSDVPAGAELGVTVHREGSDLTRTTAEVVACTDDCRATTPETPSAVVDGGTVTPVSAPGQPVLVRTNLPPGATVQIQVRSSSGASPFIKRTAGVVDGNGTVRAVFDFEGAPTGTEFKLSVVHNGTTLTSARGTVECDGDCPTATPTSEGGDGGDAEVGVVQVENGSVARIEVRLGDAETTTLAVGGPETNYTLRVVLEDRTGDDAVVLLVNTTTANQGGRTVGTADGDYVRVIEERGTLTATEYRLVLRPADDESATLATGLLVVTQDGSGGAILTTEPDPASGVPLSSAAALIAGVLLAVFGIAFLLGLVER